MAFKKGHTPWNTAKKFNTSATFKKGRKPWNYEKEYPLRAELNRKRKGIFKHSEKTKIEMSKNRQGKNGCSWKGGNINYLRRQVKIRDDYTCQICGLRDIEIAEVDHIKPKSIYPELYKCLENLITLCPNCHARKSNREKKMISEFKKLKVSI